MPLTPKQRHKLLMAGDAAWIAVVIEDLLAANPDTTLPEIDYELRAGLSGRHTRHFGGVRGRAR